jgi:signal transduction histidine kinase
MRWGIRSQLLVPLLTLLLGGVGVSLWTAVRSAARARQQIESQVRNVARVLGESSFPLTATVLDQMKGLSGAEYLLVDGDDRRIGTLAAGVAPLPPPAALVADWHHLRLGPSIPIEGQRFLCSGLRLTQPRADQGLTLYILYPESLWREALWEAVRPSLLLGGFVGLASTALALGVARRLSRRIQDLERRTRRIAAGDFSPMPLSGRGDELYDLGQSVNDMVRKLRQLQEAVQTTERLRLLDQVGGGLAHQLRNGVTGARLALQLHARGCTAAADPEALAVALRQLTLLEAKLRRFMDLGRSGGLAVEPCDLAALVEEAVALLRPQCRHAHIDLRWRSPDAAVTLPGDHGQLGQLFLNVLTNAVEAAGPGGWVEVVLASAEGKAVVEVRDSGPGPPPGVADRLFEPFVTGKREGIGLGLAVARQVALAHGGRITFRREAGQTCFRIELPLAGLVQRKTG